MAASGSLSGAGPSGAAGQGIATINAFPDEKKVRELTEQIRRLCHAHQLKLSASQQQQPTTAASMQVRTHAPIPLTLMARQCHDKYWYVVIQISQAEEIKKRLQEAITLLQETVKGRSHAII